MDNQSAKKLDNRKVASNAVMLTIRMIIVTFVGLYTSRIVFSQLGEVNYGIYGVVGGILGFMSFLTSSMAGASSRFITYEIGRGVHDNINNIFNSSFLIHCGIAVVVILVGETFGVWFLDSVLVIPEDRIQAAWWVFQFSVISSAISITQVPYTAVIMAYEKMNIYAYMELISVALKLLIVYLLSIAPFDKLVVYSFLLLLVSVLMAFSYRLYCIRTFPICRLKKVHDYTTIKKMLTFSGMDLYGNIGVTLNNQGLTYAVNIFFGVIYNTAVSLANTVNGMILSLTTTISIAFKPQIVKQYAQGDIMSMETVMTNSVKFTMLAMAVLAMPCAIEADYIMQLWLGEVPSYSVEFLRIIIIQSFVPVINNVCNAAIHANGNIKKLTFVNGSIFMIMPLAIFTAFYLGAGALWAYGIEIIGMCLIVAIAVRIIKQLIPAFNAYLFIRIIIKCTLIIALSLIPSVIIHNSFDFGFGRLVLITLSYAIVLTGLAWTIILTRANRMLLRNKVQALISKIRV